MDPLGYVERLARREKLSEAEVRLLCDKAVEILRREPNVLNLSLPLSVCGDVHGQLYDLLELFQVAGKVPFHTFLFLGDFVDRGYHSIETYLILLSYKVRYPTRMFMIRGNHESLEITQVYGFYDEVMRRYGSNNVWRYCLRTFNALPLGALIDNRIFCMHGGLSPAFRRIDELRSIDREKEVPHAGEMCDLLWSDPEENLKGWHNSPRGAGFLFGGDVLEVFRHDNKLDLIARAHQLVMEGYKWNFNQTCLTVWSAPNYCYRCGNVASVLELSEGRRMSFTIFEAAPAELRGTVPKRPPSMYFY